MAKTTSLHQQIKIAKKALQQFNQVIIVMEVHVGDDKLVLITDPETFYSDLSEDFGINLKYKIFLS